ncbi:hypothetical protein Lfu02_27590 [Longispora fulva]|uniref:DUF4245 domain-containing protein n=1 Tax=Longispora fulva TaxID=619741 RepID=A0A8J7GH20_9ACTN|nr:DUF4245 domain-containing protein [Longispora fulva]MBG6138894.1 hypothetical protein [Longispora fulva]GIG58387.1 hypothetical protein Lfu02_27590 [Longispora fulva]
MSETSETVSVFSGGTAVPVKEARKTRGAKDLAYSMLALLIPIVLMLVLYRFLGGESPTTVDPSAALTDARARASYQVWAPSGLPSGWRTSTAKTAQQDGHLVLRIGYAGPDGEFLQLTESSAPLDGVLNSAVGGGSTLLGSAEIGGRTWQRYSGAQGVSAVVLAENGRTIVLAGQAPDATMVEFARSLK